MNSKLWTILYRSSSARRPIWEATLILPTRPQAIKLFSCSTQLSMKFQSLIKAKMVKNTDLLALKLSDVVFILLINVKN